MAIEYRKTVLGMLMLTLAGTASAQSLDDLFPDPPAADAGLEDTKTPVAPVELPPALSQAMREPVSAEKEISQDLNFREDLFELEQPKGSKKPDELLEAYRWAMFLSYQLAQSRKALSDLETRLPPTNPNLNPSWN